jgi:DNA-binding beta-propeller fold protein YncE
MSRVLKLMGVPILVLSGAVAHAQPQMQFLDKWIVSTTISGMASDAQGNIIASDWDNNRILVYTGDGQQIRQWGSEGTGDGQFQKPEGIAIAPNGEIYICDFFNQRLQIFDGDGNFLRQWVFPSAYPLGQAQWPDDVAIDAQGNVYVAYGGFVDYKINVYDSAGNLLRQFGAFGNMGATVAVDRNGYVYAGCGECGIYKFDPQGTLLLTVTQIPPFDDNWTPWGPCGAGIFGASDIVVDPSNSTSVSLFMSTVRCRGQVGGEGNFVYNVGPEIEFITRIGCVYTAPTDNPWRCRDPDGSGPFVEGDGYLHHPPAVAMDPSGHLYVFDDTEGGRIQKFGWSTVAAQPTTWTRVKTLYR